MRLLLLCWELASVSSASEHAPRHKTIRGCAIYSGKSGGGNNCGFITFEQCMDTARGLGSLCQPNT